MRHKTSGRTRICRPIQWTSIQPSRTYPRQYPVRILVAGRCEVVRLGVRAWLQEEQDLQLVGEANNADALISESRRTKPNVILMESGLSNDSDVVLYKRLTVVVPSVRIIALMLDAGGMVVRSVVPSGTHGYLLMSADRSEVLRAIRTVAQGDCYRSGEPTNEDIRSLRQRHDESSSHVDLNFLSQQERRIIPLIAEGHTNKEIAHKLFLSDKTVKNYIANMFVKLGITRRTQAVALYLSGCPFRLSEDERVHG